MSTRFRTSGQSVVEKYPKLKSVDSAVAQQHRRPQAAHVRRRIPSAPQHGPAVDLSHPAGLPGQAGAGACAWTSATASASATSRRHSSYSPTGPGSAGQRDRFHVGLEANYWDWKLSAYFNKADFYDLFGPTKVGRRGYALTVEKSKNSPPRFGPHARLDSKSLRLFRPRQTARLSEHHRHTHAGC